MEFCSWMSSVSVRFSRSTATRPLYREAAKALSPRPQLGSFCVGSALVLGRFLLLRRLLRLGGGRGCLGRSGRVEGEGGEHPHRLPRLPLHHFVWQEPIAHDEELARARLEAGVAQRELHGSGAQLLAALHQIG